jgi:hypothetical protein
VPLRLGREEATEEIRRRLVAREDLAGRWHGKGRWVDLFVLERHRKIWSPYLSARLDHRPDGTCEVFARFAPHPEVWTFFMFLYFLVAFVVLFGATFGFVQWASGEAAWALWAVWTGLPVLGLCHLASDLGSRWGQDQMHELKAILKEVVEGLESEG